ARPHPPARAAPAFPALPRTLRVRAWTNDSAPLAVPDPAPANDTSPAPRSIGGAVGGDSCPPPINSLERQGQHRLLVQTRADQRMQLAIRMWIRRAHLE